MANQKRISRRDFLKKSAKASAILGAVSIVPKFVEPALAAKRDHILIGRPLPFTGPVAAFSEPEKWVAQRALHAINKEGGIYIREYGKKMPLKVKFADTSSDPTNAAELAGKLIFKDKIDIMSVSSTPLTVNPVAAICEKAQMPCLGTMVPVEIFLQGGPYYWTFMPGVSIKDFMASFLEMWTHVKTNNVVGLLAENDPDGIGWAEGANIAVPQAGYKVIDVGRIPRGTMDYTTTIDQWKKAKVEILFGNMSPPDFVRIWRQCFRAGFLPKICTIGKAILFPSAVEAIGQDLGLGTSTEIFWHPNFPFTSSLTGETARELSDAYTAETGRQWTQVIGHSYHSYEILADVLKRAQNLTKEALRKALAETDLDTIGGPVKFNKENVGTIPSGGMQWVKGKDFPFECKLVAKGNHKGLPTEGTLTSLSEFRT